LTDKSSIFQVDRTRVTFIDNLQLLLRLPILDKFRLATFHLQKLQRNLQKLVYTGSGETKVLMTLIHLSPSSTAFVAM
jgi:hypothetical protein